MASMCGVGGAMWAGPRVGTWATTGVVVVLGVEQDLTTTLKAEAALTTTNTPPPSSSSSPTDHEHVNHDWSSVVSRETHRQSPSPRSMLDLGQQLGEYMRRISDYVYWVVTGTPPTNRKRNRPEYRQRENRPVNEGPSTQPPNTNHKRHNQLEYTWVFHTNHENHQRKRRPPVSDGSSIDHPTNYKRNNDYENHQRERQPVTSVESTKRQQRPRHRDRGGVVLGPNHVRELVQTRHRNTRHPPITISQQVRDSLPTR